VLGAAAAAGSPRPRFALERGTPAARLAGGAMVVAAVVAATVPAFVLPALESRLWTELVATAIALWGLGLLLGPAGQLSLGHGAFLAIGAYTTAVVASRYGASPLLGLVIAAAVGLVVGTLVGLPALRIRGQYLAMVTFGLAVAVPMVIQRFSWFTGGTSGPPPVSLAPPSWLPIPEDRPQLWLHLVAVFVAGLVAAGLANLRRSAVGRAISASAENDVAAVSMGVEIVRTKTLAFGVSALIGAVAGGLLGLHTQAVTTESFDVQRSLVLYGAAVFGGVDRRLGGVIGAAVLVGVPWLTAKQGWAVDENLVFGALLIAGTAAFPEGVGPILRRGAGRVVAIVEGPPSPPGKAVPPAPEPRRPVDAVAVEAS
jgi:branched-chain amino acid transport system permease protein